MFEWIEKRPVRFLSIAWFLSFILGSLTVLLVDFVVTSLFQINSGNASPALTVSISLFGFTVAGCLIGLAMASLVRVHKGEISQISFNIIVFGWAVAVTVAAMLFFMLTTVLFQYEAVG